MKLEKMLIAGLLMSAGTAIAADYETSGMDIQEQSNERQEQIQELGDKHRQVWDQMDQNQDGYISREEAAGNLELSDAFQSQDENEDGQLSAEEFSDWDGAHDEAY